MFPAPKPFLLIFIAVSVNGINHNGGQSLWARVGDSVFRVPLGTSIGEYYYAYGSHGALTEELRSRRVAGQGRLHVFHLPGGPASTLGASVAESLPRAGGRRAAISLLTQLKHGQVLKSTFPPYKVSAKYVHPLNTDGISLEKKLAGLITPAGVMSHLADITTLPGHGMAPTRSYSNSTASQTAVGHFQHTFESMSYTTCLQTFPYSGGYQTNVIAVIPGSEQNGGSVTIGAHYDSRPFTGAAPGAIDNGSGSAALLAIANALQGAAFRPVRTVYLVAFAAEEPGLVGSDAFAHALQGGALPEACQASGGDADHKAIIMDEIAWRSPNVEQPTVNLEAYDWASDTLEHLGQASQLLNGGELLVEHSSNPFGSDHMSFLNRNFSAVLTIHSDDEGYPHYHKVTDTIDNANEALFACISKMNLGALLRLSGVQGMMAQA